MKWMPAAAALGGLILAGSAARAQYPTSPAPLPPAVRAPRVSTFATDVRPAQAQLPAPTPEPGNERPETAPGGAGTRLLMATPAEKVCVREMKPTTRVVYSTVCKQYCAPSPSLLDLFFNACGIGDGECAECGQVRTRTVLVKKIVPGPEVPTCALRDVGGVPCATCAPALPPLVTVVPPRQ